MYTPRNLPISRAPAPFIAPYWADVDTRINNGAIYYRAIGTATGKLSFNVDEKLHCIASLPCVRQDLWRHVANKLNKF